MKLTAKEQTVVLYNERCLEELKIDVFVLI